jgi:hypothetical protein
MLVIGGNNGPPNAFPWTSYLGEYAQIYASSAFAGEGLFRITDIAFSTTDNTMGLTRTFDFSIGLSTTSALPGNPPTDYAAIRGPDFTNVLSGTRTFTESSNFSFDLVFHLMTPFTYDPSLGNLALDVVINSSEGGGIFFQFGDSTDTGRTYNNNGDPTMAHVSDPNRGLLTQFTGDPVPEPSTLALAGVAGAALLGWRRWRKKPAA